MILDSFILSSFEFAFRSLYSFEFGLLNFEINLTCSFWNPLRHYFVWTAAYHFSLNRDLIFSIIWICDFLDFEIKIDLINSDLFLPFRFRLHICIHVYSHMYICVLCVLCAYILASLDFLWLFIDLCLHIHWLHYWFLVSMACWNWVLAYCFAFMFDLLACWVAIGVLSDQLAWVIMNLFHAWCLDWFAHWSSLLRLHLCYLMSDCMLLLWTWTVALVVLIHVFMCVHLSLCTWVCLVHHSVAFGAIHVVLFTCCLMKTNVCIFT